MFWRPSKVSDFTIESYVEQKKYLRVEECLVFPLSVPCVFFLDWKTEHDSLAAFDSIARPILLPKDFCCGSVKASFQDFVNLFSF